ncbi:hypothetical protein PTKIN_Ptkin12aG0017700 [Pterospermum kingtungense]
MGKKVLSQVQAKISKKNNGEKKQINSLIKVLRPKVYITDSSSFKSLVQDLTGNGSNPRASQLLPQIVDRVVDVENDAGEPSMESSFDDASLESFQGCNNLGLSSTDEEIYYDQACYDPLPNLDETNSSEYVFMNQLLEEDLLVYGDLQSWLLDDIDHHHHQQQYPSFNVYSQTHHHHQQEVSIYDYELSGLI